MEIEQIKLQFKRLEKHHEISLTKKDPVAFLDLAHTLRIFTDMKREIDAKLIELNFSPDFTDTIKNKKLSKIISGNKFFSIPFSSGVKSPNVQIEELTIIQKALSPDEVKMMFEAGPSISTKTGLSFTNWLGANVIEWGDPENKEQIRISISREILIKRVANMLGASHPAGIEQDNELENRYDPYIKELQATLVADGYPLTYYQLLEISTEIIRVFSPIFK